MSCVTRVTKTLEESKGITAARFDSKTGTWTISTDRGFDPDEVSRRVRVAGEEHSRELQQPNAPAWIVRWIAPGGRRI